MGNLPGSGWQKEKTNIFELEPLKTEVTVVTYLFRIALTGFLVAFALFFLVITLSLLFSPVIYESNLLNQKQTESKVLGESSSNNSFIGNLVRRVLKPLGYASLWLVKLPGESSALIDPLTITNIGEIFEYDSTRNKVVVKRNLFLPISLLLEAP